jgi:molecular chaperone GrpE
MSQPDPEKPDDSADSLQDGASSSAHGEPSSQADGAEPAEVVSQPSVSVGTPHTPAAPPPEDAAAKAQAELARVRDQLLRTAADFDNFRKRSRREVDDAQKRGKESAVKELLPVFDNLERAAAHADSAPDVKSLADGLRIVLKQFVDTLERMDVKRIPTVGQAFDPTVHEAIQHLPSAEHPAGVVLAEVQPGYALGDRLVRAAMVVVSKGPPEGEPTPS